MKYDAIDFRAMNTDISVWGVQSELQLPAYWQRPVIHLFEQVEQLASRFLESSQLQQLNRLLVGEQLQLEPRLFELIEVAHQMFMFTDGLFNPLLGQQLSQLGYDRSFEQINQSEQINLHSIAKPPTSWPYRIDSSTQTVVKLSTPLLDLGGIGKGWTVDRAAQLMRNTYQVNSGIIDAGGDMRLWVDANLSQSSSWLIGIDHPMKPNEEWLQLSIPHSLGDVAIATSSVVRRCWTSVQGETIHHILDGRSAQPVRSNVIQATVITASPLVIAGDSTLTAHADVMAKLCCMLGSERALEWIDLHAPWVGVHLIISDGHSCIVNQAFTKLVNIVEGSVNHGVTIYVGSH